VKEARLNPHSIAKQNGEAKVVKAMDIGGGFAFLGFSIEAARSPDGLELGAALVAHCVRNSVLTVQQEVVMVPLTPLVQVPLSAIRSKCAELFGVPEESSEEVPS
jgi:hypothetical protein